MNSVTCERQQILDPEQLCRAGSLPGRTVCLAHTENVQQILEQLGGEAHDLLLVQNLEISNALLTILLAHQATLGTDFRGATFTDSANFLGVTFTGTASFDGTTFTGIADFATATFNSGASFREATFTGTANFGSTVFTGEARFRRANFTGTADFARATFTGETDFGEATFTSTNFFGASFTDTADFRRATFTDTAVYMGAAFTNVASFDEATFTGANFSWAAFARTAGFRAATFTSAANFASATFTDVASFFGATFPATANFRRATFTLAADLRVNPSLCTIDLSSASFGSGVAIVTSGALVLKQLLIRDPLTVTADGPLAAIVSLEKSTLEAPLVIGDGVRLDECALSYATGLDNLRVLGSNPWGEYRHRQAIIDEPRRVGYLSRFGTRLRRKANAGETSIIEASASPAPEQVASSYRQLRSALESSKDYAGAADFYYGEMEMRRLGAPRRSIERPLLFGYKDTGWLRAPCLSLARNIHSGGIRVGHLAALAHP